ncbi:MAG: hypothetical protein IPK08_17805 [Bacteroidetes bacterium]|nr:hypothetical protein [Bacteroidota bacterium]
MLQDGFIRITTKLLVRGNGSLEGWIKRIMVNTALDAFRKNKALNHSIDNDTIEYTTRN